MYIHIYIHIYICVCVHISSSNGTHFFRTSHQNVEMSSFPSSPFWTTLVRSVCECLPPRWGPTTAILLGFKPCNLTDFTRF